MSFDLSKPIAIGSDHAGFELKMELIQWLNKNKYHLTHMGVYEDKSVDYPDYAHPVAQAVEDGEAEFGILLCGSANGVCMTANKHKGIRAAICWEPEIAKLARLHNDANLICLPARFISSAKALEILQTFMITAFEGGRHQNRINKIIDPSPQQAR
jgi:ribose 5-phosphate isomerase B